MKKGICNVVLGRAKKANGVIVVGAGRRGRDLLTFLEEYDSVSIKTIFDNNEALTGKYIDGIEIVKPYKVKENNILYVIAVDAIGYQKTLRSQLQCLGINEDDIITYSMPGNYDYLSTLDEKYYEKAIKDMYYERFGEEINWQEPRTYNEKINWEKLNIKDERKTKLSDKFLVRDWVEAQIGKEHLTKLYGVWDKAEDIDFDTLPEMFALKLNNGSGRNIVVKDKKHMNREQVCKQLNEWRNHNFAYMSLELQYKNITPKIICEEYLEGVAENVYDYNIFCFHGEPLYIWCIKESHKPGCQASFYTPEWEIQPFSFGYPRDDVIAPRPDKLEEMLELSRILCRDFKHVRVDWYNLPDGRVLFGEMTFSTWSGLERWKPKKYDAFFGNLI